MPVLHVDDIPSDLYERIRERATAENRAFTAEVIRLLRQALTAEDDRAREAHAAAVADLRRRRWAPPAGAPDSATLLREDRDR